MGWGGSGEAGVVEGAVMAASTGLLPSKGIVNWVGSPTIHRQKYPAFGRTWSGGPTVPWGGRGERTKLRLRSAWRQPEVGVSTPGSPAKSNNFGGPATQPPSAQV